MTIRAKYSLELKKKVVSMYLNNEGGYKTLSYETGVSSDVIKQWIKAYQYHGITGLKGGGKSYPSVFKEHVLNYIEEHDLSYKEASAIFNIGNHNTIKKWYKIRETNGRDWFKNQTQRKKEMKNEGYKSTDETLEQEVERLRAENEYLKKLAALVDARNLSKKNLRLKRS